MVTLCMVFNAKAALIVELPEDWVVPVGYAYSMILCGQVKDADGAFLNNNKSVLAVFDSNGTCCGLGEVSTVENLKLYVVTVYSQTKTASGMTMKLLESNSGEVKDITEKLLFVSNGEIGSSDAPVQLSLKTVSIYHPADRNSDGRIKAVEYNNYKRLAFKIVNGSEMGYYFWNGVDTLPMDELCATLIYAADANGDGRIRAVEYNSYKRPVFSVINTSELGEYTWDGSSLIPKTE